ncbi:transmembrane and coiled-coil domain protein 3 isoform X1 [Mauremys reevesii]|uniref:transmembrane and coiled-coil domain protein 3 isoform X1 n=2 Tax=Mauremys reevesii TaxID=260615 RepID=UPI00193F4274|nr:transmembrane and coiled-coil domain protein 3 isoform X1 [Mauremys reevesii]
MKRRRDANDTGSRARAIAPALCRLSLWAAREPHGDTSLPENRGLGPFQPSAGAFPREPLSRSAASCPRSLRRPGAGNEARRCCGTGLPRERPQRSRRPRQGRGCRRVNGVTGGGRRSSCRACPPLAHRAAARAGGGRSAEAAKPGSPAPAQLPGALPGLGLPRGARKEQPLGGTMPGSDTGLPVDRTYSDPERHQRCKTRVERHDMNTLSLPLNIRRGGSDTNLNFDVPDGILEFHKVKLNADSLKQKILKVTEQIKIEQTARDGNVAEYLKLVNSADKQQAGRIKQVFEKKNQKSAHSIAQLQKKLEQYHRKLKDIEQNGSSKSSKDISKDNLKDIHPPLKDGHGKSRASGQGAESSKSGVPGVSLTPPVFVFSKSREFANLIRNKFGSADNISHLKNTLDEFRPETSSRAYGGSATIVAKPKYVSDDECSSGTSGSADSNGNHSFGPGGTNALDSQAKLSMILEELREIKETQSQLANDIENLKAQFQRDYGFISQTLQEERYRYERLEDQLNDLTDLHQHETANLKQELASIEERVAYQACERSRDVQEALESCQTRVFKLEFHQQEQQALQSETVNAKVLLGKCINVILAFMTVILVCVSTIAKFIAPMMKSRFHIICTFFAVTLLAIFCKNWDHIICAIERMIIPR